MPPYSDDLVLKIFVNSSTLQHFYRLRLDSHNEKHYDKYADSGFDLGFPDNKILTKKFGNKIHLGIHCAMWKGDEPQAYYLYPRSSIVKTPMRLSNSVGIIDKGYRGEIMAVVDVLGNENNYQINAMERCFQICHPSLNHFKVEIVQNMSDLGITERNEGGFGSTGV
tara:strand:- start:255 stop:755 length:501 start_codon:yes stop_codon:yes gene_type:complete